MTQREVPQVWVQNVSQANRHGLEALEGHGFGAECESDRVPAIAVYMGRRVTVRPGFVATIAVRERP
jgi:hypothetical protein